MARGLRIWLALVSVLRIAMSQSIVASNWTRQDANEEDDNAISLAVSMGTDMVPLAAVLPLTQRAGSDIPPPGLSGSVILANASNQLSIQHDNIAIISCDASAWPGNINALDVFATAEQANATGIVWYSTSAAWCDLGGYSGSYGWIYSMKSVNDTQRMLDSINTLTEDRGGPAYLTIGSSDTATQVTNGSTPSGGSSSATSSSGQGSNPLGPSPTTAVAMIILYSITGIITALFLVIIVTGAVRAHRHPERYGPRNIIGRARQSRARGIARAMLDTIPIVKFGDREEPKPTDVELANGHTVPTDGATSEDTTERSGDPIASGAVESGHGEVDPIDEQGPSVAEGGIAAATNRDAETADQDNQGCSICTEDFEIGQDQRVLPCNHRFHPACIDPWLLEVSGTCPLCRIDLRPQTSRSSEPELDEHGNPIPSEGQMAPPLGAEGDPRRMSVRRSLMLSVMGIGRPDRMTREERVLALREYRGRQALRRRRIALEAGSSGPVEQTQEEESGLRTRLRNTFRIRTRRTGPEEVVAQAASSEQARGDDGPDVER